MRGKNKERWITGILLLAHLLLWSQPGDYVINKQRHTVTDGLGHNHVYQSFRDRKGILWLAVENGIDRFDGRSFKRVDTKGLKAGLPVNMLFEDDEHDLWILRADGVVLFLNTETECIRISTEKFGPGFPALIYGALDCGDNSFLLLTDAEKVARYRPGKTPEPCYAAPGKYVVPFFQQEDGTVWMDCNDKGHGGQLVAMDKQYRTRKTIPYSDDHIYAMGIWGKDTIHFITSDSFFLVDITGILLRKSLKEICPFYRFSDPFITGQFPKLLMDPAKQQLWFYFSNELAVLDKSLKLIRHFDEPEDQQMVVSVNHLLIDRQQVWLGTLQGLFQIALQPNLFLQYLASDHKTMSPSGLTSCRGMQQAPDGTIYMVAAPHIYRLYPNGGTDIIVTRPDMDMPQMRAMYADEENNLWFTGKCLYKYNINNKKTTGFPFSDPAFGLENWALMRTGDRIWIGKPLMWFGLSDQRYHTFDAYNGFDELRSAQIYNIQTDKAGILWLSADCGLYTLDPEKGITARYWKGGEGPYRLLCDNLRYFCIDSDGVYWLAATEGLLRWDRSSGQCRLFGEANGVPGICHGILPDDFGFLWVSSDFGLIQFNKATESGRTYFASDGLSTDEFNRLSFCKAANGEMYFGGLNGVTAFYPKKFTNNRFEKIPDINLVLTGCFLFSGDTKKEEDIRKYYLENNRIDILPGDRFLRVQFALTDYSNPAKIMYAYTIEGYENEWHTGHENELLLSGLPYGNHTLLVKAISAGRAYPDQVLRIPITVWRPFYLQWWFLLLSVAALSGGIYWLIKKRTANLNRQAIQLENAVQDRTLIIESQNEKLKNLYDLKSRLYANITHEFKTPLTMILGPVTRSLKQAEKLQQPVLQQNLEHILTNSQQLLGLINQLLDLHKLESDVITPDYQTSDIIHFLRRIGHHFHVHGAMKDVVVDFKPEQERLLMEFDPEKMEKIISNLLSNAVKFTPEGGKVEMTVRKTENTLIIEVSDNGSGIGAEHLELIFNRFYQAERSAARRAEGTGIGLTLAKELTELMGGAIRVSSEAGEGARFTLTIPFRKPTASEGVNLTRSHPVLLPSGSVPKVNDQPEETFKKDDNPVRIIVIEDNPALASYISGCLNDTYKVQTCTRSRDGLQTALQQVPDLIICDIMMPEMDGYEVCTVLKSDERTSHIPVIFLTALDEQTERLTRLQAGADAYISKPFKEEELREQVEQLITLHRRLRTKYLEMLKPMEEGDWEKEENHLQTHELEFLNKIRNAVLEQLDNTELDSHTIGKITGMSQSQLHRKITALTGMPTGRFIHHVRLREAKRLLEQKNLTIAEIAYMTGFSDPAYFTRLFTKTFGSSPRSFRN